MNFLVLKLADSYTASKVSSSMLTLRVTVYSMCSCDKAALKAAGCGDLFSKGRQVYPNPADAPLITYPENSERGEYKMKIPPVRLSYRN